MERFLACAAIGAHAVKAESGFRQVEMRFLHELNCEWVSPARLGMPLQIHNNQIRRHLHALCKQGFANSMGKGQHETFRLTRAGLLHELQTTFKMPCLPIKYFYFVFYFSKRYQQKIHQLVLAEGYEMPKALEIEIDALIDPKHLIYSQMRAVDKEIEKLEYGIKKVSAAADMSERMKRQQSTLQEIAIAIEKNYPYELNAMKKMSELYMALPAELQFDEMVLGNRHRAQFLWGPMLADLKNTKKILLALDKSA